MPLPARLRTLPAGDGSDPRHHAHVAGGSRRRDPRSGRFVGRPPDPLRLEEVAARRRLPPLRDGGGLRPDPPDHRRARVRRPRARLPSQRRHRLLLDALRADGRLLVDGGEQPLHLRPGGPLPAAARVRPGPHRLPLGARRRPRRLHPLGLQRPRPGVPAGFVPDEPGRHRPDRVLRQQLVVPHHHRPCARHPRHRQGGRHPLRSPFQPGRQTRGDRPVPGPPGEFGGPTGGPGARDAGRADRFLRPGRGTLAVPLPAQPTGDARDLRAPGLGPARPPGRRPLRHLLDGHRRQAGIARRRPAYRLPATGAVGPPPPPPRPPQPGGLPPGYRHLLRAGRLPWPGAGGRGTWLGAQAAGGGPRLPRGRDRPQRQRRPGGRRLDQHAGGGRQRDLGPEDRAGRSQGPRRRLGVLPGAGAHPVLFPGDRCQRPRGPVDAQLDHAAAGREPILRRLP